MKKILIISIVLLVILLGFGCLYWSLSIRDPYAGQQKELANYLDVRIEDYPMESSFPVGYFFTVLKPGMAIEDVHRVVKGYIKVLHCRSSSEVYYYFDENDMDALRFEIFYDENGNFKRLQGEDRDSGTIWIEGCDVGLIVR